MTVLIEIKVFATADRKMPCQTEERIHACGNCYRRHLDHGSVCHFWDNPVFR